MPYVGNTPAANFASVTKDTFNGGDTSGASSVSEYTLSKAATTNGVAVFVENVRQEPTTAYSVSGTTLTFTGTTPSGTNNVYVLHHNAPASTANHPASQDLTAVKGTFTSDVSIDGGNFVFNESSADKDFRVESNGDANCFFVDGGNNEVAVGTNTPSGHSSPNGAKFVVHTSGATLMQLNGSSSSSVGLEFTDDAVAGQLHYFHGNNSMVFTVNGTQHFSIGSDGTLLGTDTNGISSISDERLKTNIKDYTYDLEVFKKFKPKTFDWKNPKEHGDKSNVRGFIAQDILDVDNVLVSQTDIEPHTAIPNLDAEADLIPKDSDGKRLSYTSKLDGNDAMYISVIQQLIARIEALESK